MSVTGGRSKETPGSGGGITEATPLLRPFFSRCSRHSQGRATSSGPRIQPEPSQTPSGQACSRKGSLLGDRHQKSGPAAAVSSIGGPSPAGCSIGCSLPEWSANFGKRSRKTSFGAPIGPFLCLAMITSARPSGSSSRSR